jgi:hypothetical protein
MTAANQHDLLNTHRRLSRLLAFLFAFFIAVVVIAVGSRRHWFGAGPSTTFFDSKGILTGPGTFIVLIGAALAALIVFVAYKKWTLQRALANPSAARKTDENAKRALDAWLARDVLNAEPSAIGQRIEGTFRERHFTIERVESDGLARVRYTIETASSLALRVWWLGKTRLDSDGPRQKSEFETSDPHFESCCAWQSATPNDALTFLNRGDVTGTLHRVCFIAGRNDGSDEIRVAFEPGRITLTTRTPPLEFMHAASALVLLQDLVFLADAAENKIAHSILAGTGTVGTSTFGERKLDELVKPRSRFVGFLSCVMFVFLVLVPLAALWIAGSYYTAKALDMSAGMVCFFLPVLLMAIFVFTRPAVPEQGSDAANDMATVRAAALKFWEQTLRSDPSYAALLDAYERRLEKN